MVSLERFQSDLFQWAQLVLLHLIHLAGENLLGGGSRVNAVGLDGDDIVSAVLEEVLGIEGHDTALVRLGNIHEDAVNGPNELGVGPRVAGIVDDRDDVGPLLAHIDQISSGPVGEFDGINTSGLSDQIGYVTDSGTGCSSEVQHLGSLLDVDGLYSCVDSRAQLRPVGVPDSVLLLVSIVSLSSSFNLLLPIDCGPGCER